MTYKHIADSIKETENKKFVYQTKKDKWNTKNSVYIGEQEPESKAVLWVDKSDEAPPSAFTNDMIKEIRDKLDGYGKTVHDLNYALQYELDPGYFKGIYPGSDPDDESNNSEDEDSNIGGPKGTVGRVITKRGYKSDISDLQEGELGFCIDTEELYIGNKGTLRLLARVGGTAGGGGSGGGNVTADYVELVAPSGEKFRMVINDEGQTILIPTKSFLATDPAPGDSGNFNGLFINRVYIGGDDPTDYNINPCSHNFIELYNSTGNTFNLKGLSLQYGTSHTDWQTLPLRGEIKPYSSFLIRGKNVADITKFSTRFKIQDFDMSWDIPMSCKGFKFYLKIGIEPCSVRNPYNANGLGQKEDGYINLFAVGGTGQYEDIDACEEGFLQIANKFRMLVRNTSENTNIMFANTGNNAKDIYYVDLTQSSTEVYMPRSSKYGQWDYYYDKIKLNETAPNVINICFGQDGETSRTFTWQTPVTEVGYLKYKKISDTKWKTKETTRKFVAHPDSEVTVHSVIIHDLTPGTYVYKAGAEGMWSDEYQFEVKNRSAEGQKDYKILWTTDQQGWDDLGYYAWGKCYDFIKRTEPDDYDWMLNTGDISQNANRSFEWRYYYLYAKMSLNSLPQMIACGNNDLIDKKDPLAWTYYTTVENPCLDSKGKMVPSCYSFNYGDVHYICLNSNIIAGYTDLEPQIDFVVNDMKKPENHKRWLIVYIHEAPYSVRCNPKTEKFINLLYDIGVDLVLGGHHHCYARNALMGRLGEKDPNNKYAQYVVDEANGVRYVTLQATGCKIIGKTPPQIDAPFLKQPKGLLVREDKPMYAMISITNDNITIKVHQLRNVYPVLDCLNKEVESVPIDTVVVTPRRKNYASLANLNANDYK